MKHLWQCWYLFSETKVAYSLDIMIQGMTSIHLRQADNWWFPNLENEQSSLGSKQPGVQTMSQSHCHGPFHAFPFPFFSVFTICALHRSRWLQSPERFSEGGGTREHHKKGASARLWCRCCPRQFTRLSLKPTFWLLKSQKYWEYGSTRI